MTRRGKRSKRFSIELPPKGERGRSFFFHRGIVDTGIWSELKPAAQGLYMVFRYFARYDWEEDGDLEPSYFMEGFTNRQFEVCEAEINQLAKFAGIDRRTVAEAMKSLKKNFLLESFETGNGEKNGRYF